MVAVWSAEGGTVGWGRRGRSMVSRRWHGRIFGGATVRFLVANVWGWVVGGCRVGGGWVVEVGGSVGAGS